MSNKKVLNFVKSILYLREDVPKQYIKQFDEAINLYKNRKIEKSSSLMMIVNGLKYKKTADKSLNALKKYTTYEPVIGIKKTGVVFNPERSLKRFHIMCKVTLDVEYMSGKKNSINKKNKETFSESRVVIAKTITEAKKIMMDDINYEYDVEESWRRTTTDKVDFISILPLKQDIYKSTVTTMRMKKLGSQNLTYDTIIEYKDFLQTDKDFGTCVIDNIVGMYKHMTRETFINFCTKYYKSNQSPLDYDLTVNEWAEIDGVDAKCLQSFCQYYDISHYCYDVTHNCVLKYVSKSQNYEALFYFCINEHMYLIKDKALKKRLTEWAKDKTNINVQSSLFDLDYKTKTNIYDDLEIIEDVELKNIPKYESCIFMFTRSEGINDLNQVFEDFIKIYKTVPANMNIKAMNHKINSFECELNNESYYFVIDSNQSGLGINYKDVKKLCYKNNIEFKNQSFVTFVNQLKDLFYGDVNKRAKNDKTYREHILKMFKNKCNICKTKIDDFHIDHIIPLSAGGNNDEDNLQVLCLPCHQKKTEGEVENGIYKRVSPTESSFNSQVTDIINSKLCKSFAFVETIGENIENRKIFTFDINKCRSNILYYGKHNYPVFTVMDSVVKYEGQHGAGLYYIETDNYIPLRGNGWYYYPVVEHCLQNNIIMQYDIKYVILSSLSVPGEYYKNFIDHCKPILGNLMKLGVNSMIGSFNINVDKNVNSYTTGIVKGAYDAYLDHFNSNDSFINSFMIDDENYYHLYKDVKNIKYETESPFYNQIIQSENILIHNLKTLIEEKGGKVIDLNTDAVSCTFPDDILPFKMLDDDNLDDYFFDNNKKVPMYKLEEKDRLKHERCKNMVRNETFNLKNYKWTNYEDVKNNDFTPLVDTIIDSDKSFSIQANAGCGKSYLVKEIQKKLKTMGKKYITLCPTLKACLVIPDAITLCRFSNKFKNKKNMKNLNLDYIFVDEISMVHEIYYKFLRVIKQLKPNVKFIISGDFTQLLPVCDRVNDIDYETSHILFEICDGNRLYLTTCRRADEELYNICKNPLKVKPEDFKNKFYKLNLCFTNKKRMEINKRMMIKTVKKYGSGLKLEKLKNDPNSQDVELLENIPIIAMKTNSKLNIVNNEMFTIKSICKGIIEIKNDNKPSIEIEIQHFQKYFYVAYAITIHKSQGSTFDKPYTIHEWTKLDKRLKYVALSRATKKDLINIIYE